ncbi:MAG: polysaccharide biosynthesis/export family protein, partial [Acidobacteriota bacterium]
LACLFALLMIVILVRDLAIAQTPTQAEAGATSTSNDYIIGAGDLLEIRVFRQPELSGRYRVSDAGSLNLPFTGQIDVAGLSESKLTTLLKEKLLKILRQPQLSVLVVEQNSQSVTVFGAVRTPGRYLLRRGERLLDVIGRAGGLTGIAGQSINLIRYGLTGLDNQTTTAQREQDENIKVEAINLKELLNGSPALNVTVTPGDVINVPEADTIYVAGNVHKPGAYNPKEPITLSQAIALAGGTTATARSSHIQLYRTVPGKAERVEVSYSISEIEKRKVKDPILQPNDVVYIPSSESRSLGLAFVRALTGGLGGGLGIAVFR